MTVNERALGKVHTRADRVRARRARLVREIEPAPRERRIKPRRKRHPRRRFDFALARGVGVEARLPALPAVRIGPRLMTFILLATTVLGLVYAFTSPGFHVGRATVLGNRLLSQAQVRSIAQVEGELVFLINPEQVVERLMQFPEVLTATVRFGWPNRVEIQLEERYPVVEWSDAGRIWWLSSDGLAYIMHGSWPNLVRIVAEEPVLRISEQAMEPVISPEVLHAAMLLCAQLPEIEALQYDSEHGLGFVDTHGWKVYFGDEGDINQKILIYRALAEQLSDQGIQVAMVSLENESASYISVER